jgi:hypothetical protein
MISIKSHRFQKFTQKDLGIVEGELGLDVTASGVVLVEIVPRRLRKEQANEIHISA